MSRVRAENSYGGFGGWLGLFLMLGGVLGAANGALAESDENSPAFRGDAASGYAVKGPSEQMKADEAWQAKASRVGITTLKRPGGLVVGAFRGSWGVSKTIWRDMFMKRDIAGGLLATAILLPVSFVAGGVIGTLEPDSVLGGTEPDVSSVQAGPPSPGFSGRVHRWVMLTPDPNTSLK